MINRTRGMRSAHLKAGIWEPPEYYEGAYDNETEDEGDSETSDTDES